MIDLLFTEGTGNKTKLEMDEAYRAYDSLPEGNRFMLVNDGGEQREMEARGCMQFH